MKNDSTTITIYLRLCRIQICARISWYLHNIIENTIIPKYIKYNRKYNNRYNNTCNDTYNNNYNSTNNNNHDSNCNNMWNSSDTNESTFEWNRESYKLSLRAKIPISKVLIMIMLIILNTLKIFLSIEVAPLTLMDVLDSITLQLASKFFSQSLMEKQLNIGCLYHHYWLWFNLYF